MVDTDMQPSTPAQVSIERLTVAAASNQDASLLVALHPERTLAVYRQFLKQFPGEVLYAIKANPDPVLMGLLHGAGMQNFDTASLTEVVLASEIGGCAYFNNPAKLKADIQRAYHEFGVREFTVDAMSEVAKILGAVPQDDLRIGVRFVPPRSDAVSDLSSKFGAGPTEAAAMLRYLANLGIPAGLSFHPGWQLADSGAHAAGMRLASMIATGAGVMPAYINVGGGFPTRPGVSLNPYFAAIREMKSNFGKFGNVPLLCEPGGSLAAPFLDLGIRIVLRKGDSLYLSDGVYGAFFTLPQLPFKPRYAAIGSASRSLAVSAGETREFTVFGPTCDSIDKLPYTLSLPADIGEDDWIIFEEMGAYSFACASEFNGFLPGRKRFA